MIKRRGAYLLLSGWAQSQAMLHLLQGAKRAKFLMMMVILVAKFSTSPDKQIFQLMILSVSGVL